MWNRTPLPTRRAADLPDRAGVGLRHAIRDVVGDEPLYIHDCRPDVDSQAVSFWRAAQTQVWQGHADPERDSQACYHAGAIGHVVENLRCQESSWRTWFADEGIAPIDIAYPVLWRNLMATVAGVLEELGLAAEPAPPPMPQRQADHRSDEWVERYRREAPMPGLPS